MRNATIFADYGKSTGSGHLMRCGSLAKELKSDFNVKFVCKDKYRHYFTEFTEKIGCTAIFSESLRADIFNGSELIIIDSYSITSKFLTDVKSHCELCAVIDDNCTLPFYDADFIINQNIGAENFPYKAHARKDTKLLLGMNYLMLRDEFAAKTPIDILAPVKRVAVTMGGADLKNATEKVLELMEGQEYILEVAVGPDFGERPELIEYAARHKNIILNYNADMSELFSRCQAAVSACGSTIYELAALGVPTIGIVTADNQQNPSIAMENGGIIACAGLFEKLSKQYFDVLFEDVVKDTELRKEMHKKQTVLAARDGAKRIKETILERFESDN